MADAKGDAKKAATFPTSSVSVRYFVNFSSFFFKRQHFPKTTTTHTNHSKCKRHVFLLTTIAFINNNSFGRRQVILIQWQYIIRKHLLTMTIPLEMERYAEKKVTINLRSWKITQNFSMVGEF